jgi:TonB family protein
MKNQRALPLVAVVVVAVMMFAAVRVMAADVKLIANGSVKADMISASEVKSVFLEEHSSLRDGTHVEPVLETDGPVHQAFLHEYLGGTDDDLQNYYRALVFSGRGSMPKQLGSDAEVVAYVARTKGAIGYVNAETIAEDVKTLTIVRGGNDAQRKLITRIEPEYPDTLKRLNISGTVRLQLAIAPSGNVETVEVLGGNPILGEAAVAAVKQWVYTAGHSRTVAELSISFGLHR